LVLSQNVNPSTASDDGAVVVGGGGNTASGSSSGVLAGGSNTAGGEGAAVIAGGSNIANGSSSVVVGGQASTAHAENSFIGAGYGNTVLISDAGAHVLGSEITTDRPYATFVNSLVIQDGNTLSFGGIEFPDGTQQTTAFRGVPVYLQQTTPSGTGWIHFKTNGSGDVIDILTG
jgi:hypothetical protein